MSEIKRPQKEEDKEKIINFFSEIRDLYDPGEKEFQSSIVEIQNSYHPDTFAFRRPVDYAEESMRCAYIHKYAPIHAALIQKVLLEDLLPEEQNQIFLSDKDAMNICSLGSAACSDMVGVLAALSALQVLPQKIYRFTSIDIIPDWETVHDDVNRSLEDDNHGIVGGFFPEHVTSTFVTDNLLDPQDETASIMASSDLIIMSKFISELRRREIPGLMRTVLDNMNQNAVLLFVDNSGGDFYKDIWSCIEESGMELEVLIDKVHVRYEDAIFSQTKHGRISVYNNGLSVAIVMFRKLGGRIQNKDDQLDKAVRLHQQGTIL